MSKWHIWGQHVLLLFRVEETGSRTQSRALVGGAAVAGEFNIQVMLGDPA